METQREPSEPREHDDLVAQALRQHQAAGASSATASVTIDAAESRITLPPDGSFAGYQILREIHRGGQGVVFQAVQKSTNRKVAIKVMREGPFAGGDDRARFDREVQILAQLKHPNIVAIHDTGVAAGCHYFVMDYISGQPLDVHMASGPRSVKDTLRLFASICTAVNAAHLRGIIHRDLKPGNIRIDHAGEPHVLDFGLAKVATHGADVAAMTQTGQFVGSVPWASPEQAECSSSVIDIRTDVYSLGVVLYQMLTGKFPYEVVGAMRDVLERVATAAPVRPRTIRREINDEVETIVLKCLSKDRERRYQSAGELARDVERYLRGEPIEAKRDSLGYLVRVVAWRYRVPLSVAGLFLVVLAVALVVSLSSWQTAVAAARVARLEADRADAVAGFMNEVLRTARPAQLSDALDRAVAGVAARFGGDPATEASVRDSLGLGYRAIGRLDDAETQLRAALGLWRRHVGDDHPATLSSLINLAVVRRDQSVERRAAGALDEAESFYREAAERGAAALGADAAHTLAAQHNLAELLQQRAKYGDAERLYRTVLDARRRSLGGEHPDTLRTVQGLAALLTQLRRFDEADELLRDAVAASDQPTCDAALRLELTQVQGACLLGRGAPRRAAPLLERALADSRRIHGRDHVRSLEAQRELARGCFDLGELDRARELLVDVLDRQREQNAADGELLRTENLLAAILLEQGDLAAAEPIIAKAREVVDAAASRNDPIGLMALSNEALLRRAQGAWSAAAQQIRAVLAARRALLGERHPHTLRSLHDLGSLLLAQRDAAAAEPHLRLAATTAQQELPAGHWLTGTFLLTYAECLEALGEAAGARERRAEAYETLRAALGDEHPRTKRANAQATK